MAINFSSIWDGLKIKAKAVLTSDTVGEIETSSVDNKTYLHNGTIRSPILTEDSAAVIENKDLVDSTTNIVDNTDPTIRINFDAAGTTSTRTTVEAVQTVDRTITLPDATDTLVGKATTDTLTNKSLSDATTSIVDSVDPTIQVKIDAAGSTATITTITSSQTVDQVITLPDATDTLIGKATTDTLTNKTIDANGVGNSISNLEVADLAAGVLNTSVTMIGASDTQVPSALAIKTYVDNSTGSTQTDVDDLITLSGVPANSVDLGTFTGTTITDDQTIKGALQDLETGLEAHITDTTDAHDATAISTTPISGVTGTDVQANLASLKSLIDAGGNGDVMGPASSTDNAVARFDSTTGKIIQNSSVTISDVGVVAGMTIDTATNGITNLDNANFKVNAMIDAVKIADGSVTNAEFQRLDGVTSPIQTQIDSKVNTTGGSVITPTRLDAKQDTLANLTTYALTATNGQFAFSTDTKETFVVKDGQLTSFASSGSGGINYITNYTADTNINGWVTYANAAGTAPVTGTGGSPTVTYTRSTSSPLRGTASFLYTKPASNVQGQGFSYNFTIDPADQGKVLQGSFDYQIASGTFADNDMSVWIYDITNARMIQPTPYLLKNSGIIERFPLEFQTAINSTSYRLIIHQASTSTSAYTIKLDNFFVGPSAKLYGSAVTDWISYTPVISGLGTGGVFSAMGKWRRVGDSIEVLYNWTKDASAGTGSAAVNVSLPSGMSVDSTKLPSGSPAPTGEAYTSLTTITVKQFVDTSNNSLYLTTNANSVVIGSNITASSNYRGSALVPIQGWSSSQVMSSDASTRVVNFTGYMGAVNTLTANVTNLPLVTRKDSHGTWNGSTYTIPVAGDYEFRCFWQANGSSNLNIYLNGSANRLLSSYSSVANVLATGSVVLENLKAGDVVSFRSSTGVNNSSGTDYSFSITRISGPSQIMASETVEATYSQSSGQSIPNNTNTIVNYSVRESDSNGSVTVGASWAFTAPMSGKYLVTSYCLFAPNATGVREIYIYKNNTAGNPLALGRLLNASQGTVQTTTIISLLAGETLIPVAYQNSGGALALEAASWRNKISIIKVGNY